MQLQKTALDGSSSGLAELSLDKTNQELIDLAISESSSEDGFHVVIGNNLVVPKLDQPNPSIASQSFLVFASNGVLVATNLVTE